MSHKTHPHFDRTGVEHLIQTYFDGLYDGDADKLASVFAPSSSLTWVHEGQLKTLSRDAWLEVVRARPSPRSRGLARDDGILMLDHAGVDTALVKVKCQIPPLYFTDYLSLLRTGGHWQIVQKVYAAVTQI
jgi:hypothetical protein